MKNNKKMIIGLALSIIIGTVSNAIWAMNQQTPIYEILAREKVNYEKEQDKYLDIEHDADFYAQEYLELRKKYMRYEGYLEQIKHMPRISIWGGINYAMTLKEMKQKINEKFEEMKRNGLIISKDAFERIKNKYFLHSADTHDLTRIWGNEYLKSKISASPYLSDIYDVPRYIIVTDNPQKISVEISFGNKTFPVVTTINNGAIYFEKIIGKGIASQIMLKEEDIGINSDIGFTDFSDPGNIIKQRDNGKYYIVDTEFKSFDIYHKLSNRVRSVLEYAAQRFKYLNQQINRYTYDFEL